MATKIEGFLLADNANIIVNVYDGTRRPLDRGVEWSAQVIDGRSLNERKTLYFPALHGASQTFNVPFFDNFGDNYTVILQADGYADGAWRPVKANQHAPVTLDVMLLPKNGRPLFGGATWDKVTQRRPAVADMIRNGVAGPEEAAAKYHRACEERPLMIACFLNIVTALADMTLPSGKNPLDYYWNTGWPAGGANDPAWITKFDDVMKQDRCFCYVDQALISDVRNAARVGAFSQEPNPEQWGHKGATESYKQTQFDVANAQLTFHGRDTTTFNYATGRPVKCVKIEPDIDYYKDLLAHGLVEVIPNSISHGLTDPKVVYFLRWMAAQREAHLPAFDPLYTVE